MKWAYSIQQKLKAALLLAVVCAVVLITNLLGRYHMGELGDSFSSVIKDRLVVESYIYMISDHLHQKKNWHLILTLSLRTLMSVQKSVFTMNSLIKCFHYMIRPY